MGTSITPHKIDFTAASPDADTPAAQIVTATFGADIAHVTVAHTGRAIAGVSSALSGRTARIEIRPNTPASAGAGVTGGTVSVTGQVCADTACSSLVAVRTQTVTVSYQVSPAVRLVMPEPKKSVTIRLDADVVRFFKREPRYQTKINAVLRSYMRAKSGG